MTDLSINWHYFDEDRHAILQYEDKKLVSAYPVSMEVAELLVDSGMHSASSLARYLQIYG